MTPWVAQYIPIEDQGLFFEIREIVEHMKDVPLGTDEEGEEIIFSCHILCRALIRLYPSLRVEDGFFRTGLSHSWLVTPRKTIMDFYVPGAIGCLAIPAKREGYLEVFYSMYEKNGLAEMYTVFSSWSFDRAVGLVERALRAVAGHSLPTKAQ